MTRRNCIAEAGRAAERLPRNSWPFAAAAAALWLGASAATANVFVEDRRKQRDASAPIFRSVGMLHHPGIGAGGTAFLAGRCHVVTAYHVAFMRGRDPVTGRVEVAPGKVGGVAEFLIGPDSAVPGRFAEKTRARVVAFGRFSDADFTGMAGDWAILRLDECLGGRYGFLRLARPRSDSPMPTRELMTIGFPASRAGKPGITVERGCSARDHGPVDGLVGVDCAFENGMSGGPILERQSGSGWRVVGIVQQSTAEVDRMLPAYSMEHRNQMVHVTAFRKALEDALRAEARRSLPGPGK
jgi:hypothetical protein